MPMAKVPNGSLPGDDPVGPSSRTKSQWKGPAPRRVRRTSPTPRAACPPGAEHLPMAAAQRAAAYPAAAGGSRSSGGLCPTFPKPRRGVFPTPGHVNRPTRPSLPTGTAEKFKRQRSGIQTSMPYGLPAGYRPPNSNNDLIAQDFPRGRAQCRDNFDPEPLSKARHDSDGPRVVYVNPTAPRRRTSSGIASPRHRLPPAAGWQRRSGAGASRKSSWRHHGEQNEE